MYFIFIRAYYNHSEKYRCFFETSELSLFDIGQVLQ